MDCEFKAIAADESYCSMHLDMFEEEEGELTMSDKIADLVERITDEYLCLQQKIAKIRIKLGCNASDMSPKHYELLVDQKDVMIDYAIILEKRIADLYDFAYVPVEEQAGSPE